jgi:hypothetical protein
MRERDWHFALAGFLAIYALFLSLFGSGAAAASDSSGYLNCARMLAEGKLAIPLRAVPGLPLGLASDRELAALALRLGPAPGTLVPTYPVGLPLHLAAASWLVGWGGAGVVVNAVAALSALLLLFALGRHLGLPPAWAFACVVLLAVFPVTIRSFTWVMSDGLATTWCIAAVYCAFRAREGGERWALLAGVSLGFAVLVRPTNALLLVAVAAVLPLRPRPLAALVAGGLPAAVFLGFYNHALFGKALATGYSDVPSLLAWSYFLPRIRHFGAWIARFLSPIALLAWAVSAYRAFRGDRRHLALFLWVCAIVGFYAFYLYSVETWWYLRFILPAMPALLLGAALAGLELGRNTLAGARSRFARALVGAAPLAVFVLATVLSLASVWKFRLWTAGENLTVYERASALVAERVGPGAVVVSKIFSGAVYFYTAHPVIRYDNISPRTWARFAEHLRASGTPVCALLLSHEVEKLRVTTGAPWVEIGALGNARLLVPAPGGAAGRGTATP